MADFERGGERSSVVQTDSYSILVEDPFGLAAGGAEVTIAVMGPKGCPELRITVDEEGLGAIKSEDVAALVRRSGAHWVPKTVMASAAKPPWAPASGVLATGKSAWKLVLRTGGSLLLRLTDDIGRPILDLPRVAWPAGSGGLLQLPVAQGAGEYAQAGVYEIGGVPEGDQVLWVSSAQHALQPIRVLSLAGLGVQSRALRLARPLSVRVTGRGHGPIAGARLEVRSYPPSAWMQIGHAPVLVVDGVTDSSGLCRLEGLDVGGGVRSMTVTAPGWQPLAVGGLTSGLVQETLSLELTPAALVRLDYFTEAGTPLRGLVRARVAAQARTQPGAPTGVVATELVLNGRTELNGIPVGWPLQIDFLASSSASSEVLDRLDCPALLAGQEAHFERLLGLQAVNVEAAVKSDSDTIFSVNCVPIVPEGTEGAARTSSSCVVASGSVAQCFVPPGDYRIVGHLGLLRAEVVRSIAGPTTVILDEWGGLSLRGRLIAAADDVALAGRELSFRSKSGGDPLRGMSGPDGRFELHGWDGQRGKLCLDLGAMGQIDLVEVGSEGDLGVVRLVESTLMVRCRDSIRGVSAQVALDIVCGRRGPPLAKPARLARYMSDVNGELRLVLPAGTYRVQPVLQGHWGLATEVQLGGAVEESVLEVSANRFAEVTWNRPEAAQGAGNLTATCGEFSSEVELPAVPRAGLTLPVGTIYMRFEGIDGRIWSGTLQVEAP
jgi:hypothetical protein